MDAVTMITACLGAVVHLGSASRARYITFIPEKEKRKNLKFSQIPLTTFFILPNTPIFSCFVLTM